MASITIIIYWIFGVLGVAGLVAGFFFLMYWLYYSIMEIFWVRGLTIFGKKIVKGLPEEIKQKIEKKNAENKERTERAREFYAREGNGDRDGLEGRSTETSGDSESPEGQTGINGSPAGIEERGSIQIPSASGNIADTSGDKREHRSSKKTWERFE